MCVCVCVCVCGIEQLVNSCLINSHMLIYVYHCKCNAGSANGKNDDFGVKKNEI